MDTQHRRILFAAIIVLAIFTRFPTLMSESLWFDEIWSLEKSTGTIRDVFVGSTNDVHPPLYYILLHYWIELVGISVTTLRFPSAVFSLIQVALIYFLGRELFDDHVGLLAAFLITLSTFHIQYAQEARMYALLGCLTVASYLFLIRIHRSRRARIGYVGFTILLMYTHVYGVFAVIAQNVYVIGSLLYQSDSPFEWRSWLPNQLILTISFLPWLFILFEQVQRLQSGSTASGWIPEPSIFVLGASILHFVGPLILLPVVFALLLHYYINISKIRDSINIVQLQELFAVDRNDFFLIIWFSMIIAIPLVLSIVVVPIFWSRFAIGAASALYLMIAKSIVSIDTDWIQVGILLILILSSSFFLYGFYTSDQKIPWDDSTSYVESNIENNAIVIGSTPTFHYYFNATGRNVTFGKDNSFSKIPTNHSQIWILSVRYDEKKSPKIDSIPEEYCVEETRTYRGNAGRFRGYNGEGILDVLWFTRCA